MSIHIEAGSVEYVRIPVTATEHGTPVVLTELPVEIAFTRTTPPTPGDWHSAGWETDNRRTYARILLGPGSDIDLPVGHWRVWLRITAVPEVPVKQAGTIHIR